MKIRKVFYALYLMLLTGVCFLLAMEGTEAATYNFYFNNTEQGPNSNASPTLTVKDGKKVKAQSTDDEETLTEEDMAKTKNGAPVSPQANAAATSTPSTPEEDERAPEQEEPYSEPAVESSAINSSSASLERRYLPNLRFFAGSARLRTTGGFDFGSGHGYDSRPYVGIGLFPGRNLGFNVLYGGLTGLEMEWLPFEPLKRAGKFFGGLSAGYGTFVRNRRPINDWQANAGVNMGMNLTSNLGASVAYRFNPLMKYSGRSALSFAVQLVM